VVVDYEHARLLTLLLVSIENRVDVGSRFDRRSTVPFEGLRERQELITTAGRQRLVSSHTRSDGKYQE
jgi:hypothetical protein